MNNSDYYTAIFLFSRRLCVKIHSGIARPHCDKVEPSGRKLGHCGHAFKIILGSLHLPFSLFVFLTAIR
jgi:hypothetical protein